MVDDNYVTESNEDCPLGALEEEASTYVKMAEKTKISPGTLDKDGTSSTS
jgi:hypothetical protein